MTGDAPPAVRKLLREAQATVVYVADGPTGETVVVKRLGAEAEADPIGLRRFARESRFAELLRHPSLPRLVASGKDWFAMEYLQQSITSPDERRHILASGMTRNLLRRLAETIAYVHARGIIHRDIKPGHVMLRDTMPVLIDFGIAAIRADDILSPAEFAGSPAWMAPEQISHGLSGTEADIWSFGLTAMWLLTGLPPYPGKPHEVLDLRRAGAVPQLDWQGAEETGGRELATILRQCLTEPHERPDAASLCRLLS